MIIMVSLTALMVSLVSFGFVSAIAVSMLLEKRPTRRSHYFRSAHVTYIVYS
jgi:hypothetical protein